MSTTQKIDTTIALYDKLYPVEIQNLFTKSYEDRRLNGSRISGARDMDRLLPHVWTHVYLPIIVEDTDQRSILGVRREGGAFRGSEETIIKIYTAITDHIAAWQPIIDMRPHEAPLKDIMELDNLAAFIYNQALTVKPGYKATMMDIMDAIIKGNGYNRNMLGKKTPVASAHGVSEKITKLVKQGSFYAGASGLRHD